MIVSLMAPKLHFSRLSAVALNQLGPRSFACPAKASVTTKSSPPSRLSVRGRCLHVHRSWFAGETAKDGHLPETDYLEYEAYEPMALAKMKQVAR